jgi:hypothetical protein
MKTQREREAERRREKLEHVQQQIRNGSLVVRKMTPEERERYAPRPAEQRAR